MLALLLAAALLEVPGISGHMTDPLHRLSDADRRSVEERLGKIQDETHVDVAGWISGAPEEQAVELGERAVAQWNIGRDWDGAVFFLFPSQGRVRIIQPPAKAVLPAEEVAKLAALDSPEAELHLRIARLAEKARTLLVARTAKQARPWGDAHPQLGRRWLMLAAAILAGAAGLSFARRRPNHA